MSTTSMSSSNALTVKLWERKAWAEALQRTAFGHLFNRGCVYYPEEFKGSKSRGDNVTFSYTGKLTGVPLGEGQVAYGNEEALDIGSFSMSLGETFIRPVAMPADDSLEQQRTKLNFAEKARASLTNRSAELLDYSCFNQLAGISPTSLSLAGTTYTSSGFNSMKHVLGLNSAVAPTTNRLIRPSAISADESLTSDHKFSLELIDYALELADRSRQPLERLSDQTFDLYLSPEQVTDLRHDSSGVTWYTQQLAHIQAGKDNTIEKTFKNNMVALGVYNNVNIYQHPRVAYGVNSSSSAAITSVRRAVLVGKDALAFASADGGRPTDTSVPFKFKEQMMDYDRALGIGAQMIYGLKKMSPSNGDDIGVIVIPTYAAAHGV